MRLSALCARAERELRDAARELRNEDPLVAAYAAFAFAELREELARLREQALRQSGH